MIGNDDAKHRWSIGELAQATGVTVRTLRHYDEMGLLRPSERTASGHRRYAAEDVRRLYRVCALRALGVPLEQIKGVLGASSEDLAGMHGLLVAQLGLLTAQADTVERLIQQVRGLLQRLEAGSMPGPDTFMTTLEMISVMENYFSEEQLQQLARRREALGSEAVEETKTRWAGLVEQLLSHIQDGTPVDQPQVQELLHQWDTIGVPFQPEDITYEQRELMQNAIRQLGQDHSGDIFRNLPWPAEQMTALYAYLEQARVAQDDS
ncbi:MAG: MerR family transcriptional regulator [Micropruina sp.]|uniref:MerR family transcriptional regulator n=1 Tax=Micropruina sp. TaxID=2737536 RepID=UPI0039E27674